MTYNKFIELVCYCPYCNSIMVPEKLDIIKGFSPSKYVLVFICNIDNHYESYGIIEGSDIKIEVIIFQINDLSVMWDENNKSLIIRNVSGEIFLYKTYKNKIFKDWLINPYKNIINKSQSLMLLL